MIKQDSKKMKRMYITKIKNPKTKAIIGWDLKDIKGKNRQKFSTQKEAIETFKNMNVDARVWVTGITTGKFKYTIVSTKIKGDSIEEIRASKKVFEGDKEVHISVLDNEVIKKVEKTTLDKQKIEKFKEFWKIVKFVLFFLIVGMILFVIIFCILILSGAIN